MITPTLFDTPTPCATVDPDIFFPPKGGSPQRAKHICSGCYAKRRCADEAVAGGYTILGVWGETTDHDRRKIRKARRHP